MYSLFQQVTRMNFTEDLIFKRGDYYGVYRVSGEKLYYDLKYTSTDSSDNYCTGKENLRPEINDNITLTEKPEGNSLSLQVTYWDSNCGKKLFDIPLKIL